VESPRDAIARWIERELERSKRVYQSHGMAFRVLWIVAGGLLILAGLAMTILPGPATVVIPTGLVMLAAASKTMRGWLRRGASRLRTRVSTHRERKGDSRRSAGVPGESR
jgi:Putative transmembrane protein (PGPGW)